MITNFEEDQVVLCLESGIEIRIAKEMAKHLAERINDYYEDEEEN